MIYKKIIPLSLAVVAVLNAGDIQLSKISVESTMITEVSENAQQSADLAQALSSSVPSIDMSRRSGIANDIFIRGQKRDNISVVVDGTKVHGACINRMDPPTSHIVTSQIQSVEVIEGPFDVEDFGTLSGGLKITTKKPTKELQGEVNFGLGSWGYKKIGASVSGGTDIVRALASVSHESSNQYKDGDGNTLAEQTKLRAPAMNQFQPKYQDVGAYTKKSAMAKLFINITDKQELRLSYTGNRSDNVLYANSQMDAAYDDSNIYAVEYNIRDINSIYKNANIKYYYSDVDHPMDTRYRMSGATNYTTNHLKTTMQGIKLKNDFDIAEYKLLVGLDASRRTWEGKRYQTNALTGMVNPASIATSLADSETQNSALFAKAQRTFGNFKVEAGTRLDATTIKSDDITKDSRDYNALNANLLTTYNINKENKIFFGIGSSSRVPDARELYLMSPHTGNQNLNQVKNREADLGYELSNDRMRFKIKTFYSMLEDYIYYNRTSNAFNNVDATIYGAEISTSYYLSDYMTLDAFASYKRGKKDESLAGQTDKNLADMAPLRGKVALSYEYSNKSMATIEAQASDKWSTIDRDNGEQVLKAWAIANMRIKHQVSKNTDLTLGINNFFNQTYAMSNTYADLVLLSAGAGTNRMLLNEPGRYFYTNLNFKF